MNITKYYLNAINPRVAKDNRMPISQTSIRAISGVSATNIKKDLDNMDESITVTKGLNGTYMEVKIIKPTPVPKFILMNLSTVELSALLYFYENNINDYDIKNLDYKQVKTYYGSKVGLTTFYKLEKLIEKLTSEDLFGHVQEEDKIFYDIGDNVIYSEELDSFIYSQGVVREAPSEQAMLTNYCLTKWKATLASANKRNLEFSITADDIKEQLIKQQFRCFYTKQPLEISNKIDKRLTPSIDRVDNTKGYTKDNTVFCLNIVNSMKSDQSLNDFLYYCELITSNK